MPFKNYLKLALGDKFSEVHPPAERLQGVHVAHDRRAVLLVVARLADHRHNLRHVSARDRRQPTEHVGVNHARRVIVPRARFVRMFACTCIFDLRRRAVRGAARRVSGDMHVRGYTNEPGGVNKTDVVVIMPTACGLGLCRVPSLSGLH